MRSQDRSTATTNGPPSRITFALLVLLATALLLLASGGVASKSAAAATCGGTVPCTCGDTLTEDRSLTDDPILSATCGSGLKLNKDGVTLDCKGKAIIGNGRGDGIRIAGEDQSVLNCGLSNFRAGIKASGIGGYSLENNLIKDVGVGIQIRTRGGEDNSSGSSLLANTVINASRSAFVSGGWFNELVGDDLLTRNVALNSRVGFEMKGHEYVLDLNKAQGNDIGFKLTGRDADVEENEASGNGIGFAFKLMARKDDFGSTISGNVSENNTKAGFIGMMRGGEFSSNLSQLNGGQGAVFGGGKGELLNTIDSNVIRFNGGNGLVVTGAAKDKGSNIGQGNGGAVQCSIAGVNCL